MSSYPCYVIMDEISGISVTFDITGESTIVRVIEVEDG